VRLSAAFVYGLTVSAAWAEPRDRAGGEDAAPASEGSEEHTAGPGDAEARGMERKPRSSLRSIARVFPRGLLYVPGVVIDTVSWPLRWAAIGLEKSALPERTIELLCDDRVELCIYPTALVETGFGLNAGVRLSHTNLLGGQEHLALRAGWGGQFRQRYGGRLHVPIGDRSFVRFRAQYQIQPDQYFYGFGTNALEPEPLVTLPVALDRAVETRYLERRFYTLMLLGHQILRHLEGSFSVSFEHSNFAPREGSGLRADEVYGEDAIPGFLRGRRQILPQLGLVADSRSPKATSPTGVRAAAYGGPAVGAGEDPSRFFRWEGTLAAHLELLRPHRVVTLAATGLGVASLDGDPVPFTDRPALGGPHLLRGYRLGRFRDDAALVLTAQYRWPIHFLLDAYLFAEAGRTYARTDDFTLDGLKPAYGGGLGLHTDRNVTARLQVARGEEEIQVVFVLEPVFERKDPQEREE